MDPLAREQCAASHCYPREVCGVALGRVAARIPRHRHLIVNPLLDLRGRAAPRKPADPALGRDSQRPRNDAPSVFWCIFPLLPDARNAKVIHYARKPFATVCGAGLCRCGLVAHRRFALLSFTNTTTLHRLAIMGHSTDTKNK